MVGDQLAVVVAAADALEKLLDQRLARRASRHGRHEGWRRIAVQVGAHPREQVMQGGLGTEIALHLRDQRARRFTSLQRREPADHQQQRLTPMGID
jgi:hypothetical protein